MSDAAKALVTTWYQPGTSPAPGRAAAATVDAGAGVSPASNPAAANPGGVGPSLSASAGTGSGTGTATVPGTGDSPVSRAGAPAGPQGSGDQRTTHVQMDGIRRVLRRVTVARRDVGVAPASGSSSSIRVGDLDGRAVDVTVISSGQRNADAMLTTVGRFAHGWCAPCTRIVVVSGTAREAGLFVHCCLNLVVGLAGGYQQHIEAVLGYTEEASPGSVGIVLQHFDCSVLEYLRDLERPLGASLLVDAARQIAAGLHGLLSVSGAYKQLTRARRCLCSCAAGCSAAL